MHVCIMHACGMRHAACMHACMLLTPGTDGFPAMHAVPLGSGNQVPPTGVRRVGAVGTTTAAPAADVAVAVLDTGVSLKHPDLNVLAGANCITGNALPDDRNGHGSHCAGSIAASNNNQGVIGVAPGTTIVAVKVSSRHQYAAAGSRPACMVCLPATIMVPPDRSPIAITD